MLDRQAAHSLLWRVLALVLLGWVLLTQLFAVWQVSGNEMFPALKDGDLVLAFRAQREYTTNDVILYTQNGETRAGRIAACEGDEVLLDEGGSLLVNGVNQAGEIVFPTYPREAVAYPYQVPQGCVFVLGDYRTQAQDSRDFGAVPLQNITGKVITILRRRGL